MRNDGNFQKALFNRYGSGLLGICHRYAHNRQDAEDILQEAFIKIFKKISQYKAEGSFEGWLRKIVVNTALKKYALLRYSKEVLVNEIYDNEDSAMVSVSSFDHLTEKDILLHIHNLPDGYKIIFNLYVIEGYQHDEIAQMLGIQPSTSRSQLVKARQLLKKELLQSQKIAV